MTIRYHPFVFGFLYEVPILPITYASKVSSLVIDWILIHISPIKRFLLNSNILQKSLSYKRRLDAILIF